MVVGEFTQDVDVVIVGWGPGSFAAACRAAKLGKTVAGVGPPSADLDWDQREMCRSLGIDLFNADAYFESEKSVRTISKQEVIRIRFRKAIIATGSTGNQNVATMFQKFLKNRDTRKWGNTLIVGGTPLAIEAATELNELRAHEREKFDVTLLAEDGVLPNFDSELVQQVVQNEAMSGISIVSEVDDVNQFDYVCHASDDWQPCISQLQLDAAGVAYTKEGIQINSSCQTTNPRIYAVGSCTGTTYNDSFAIIQGRVAAESACGIASVLDTTVVPRVVDSCPQLAQCGQLHLGTSVSCNWKERKEIRFMGELSGITKISYDPESLAVLGIGMVGNYSIELISGGVIALEMGATLYDLASIANTHIQTYSESLNEAARIALDSI